MSDFRFGFDDYRLNYYPPDATDGMGGVDWDNVERVEIEYDVYVKERTCEMTRVKEFQEYEDCIFECWTCSACGRSNNEHNPKFCPNCGARVRKAVER